MLHRHTDGIEHRVIRVYAAQHGLHRNLVGRQPGERNGGGQRHLRAQQRGVRQPGAVDLADLYLRPGVEDLSAIVGQPTRTAELLTVDRRDRSVQRLRGRCVILLGVFANHPRCQHLRPEDLQGVPHHLDPSPGDRGIVALVEFRRHSGFEQAVQRGGFQVVAALVGNPVGGRYLPTVFAVIPLVPPTVADGEVEPAVESALHAGGAAGLQGTQRVVQPHIAAPVQESGHGHVVVRQERDPVPHLGPVGEPHDLLDQRLTAVVGRMRLACHNHLDRPFLVQQQTLQAIGVAQHQGQSLVGRYPPREPDRQHLGSKAFAIQPNSASGAPRSSQDRRSRRRTSATSCSRS